MTENAKKCKKWQFRSTTTVNIQKFQILFFPIILALILLFYVQLFLKILGGMVTSVDPD